MKISADTTALLQAEIQRQALPEQFMHSVEHWLLPIAGHLRTLHEEKGGMLLVSFNGSQGSGKSTLTRFLALLLKHQFGLNAIDISIDDFYLTRAQRQQLARDVHPLFSTRGVPGTHDVQLARATLDCLRESGAEKPCKLPRFDKAIDDRAAPSQWTLIDDPVDIVLFEGWCNHAPIQNEGQLIPPINDLEKNEDSGQVWRNYANNALKDYHEQLFSQADLLIYLQIPYFEIVYEWRGLQEKKLADARGTTAKALMNESELRRFIQHYERITRACLAKLPQQAHIVVELDSDHQIQAIRFNESSITVV